MAIERGRIDASEAGPRELRDQTEAKLALDIRLQLYMRAACLAMDHKHPLPLYLKRK